MVRIKKLFELVIGYVVEPRRRARSICDRVRLLWVFVGKEDHMRGRLNILFRWVIAGFFVVMVLMLFEKSLEASVVLGTFHQGKGKVEADAKVIYRYEFWNWFEPTPQPNDDNTYGYCFTRTLFGLRLTLPNIGAYFQGQNAFMWNLPDDAVALPPGGPMGAGAVYYAHGGHKTYGSTIIRQLYLEIPHFFLKGLFVRGGRFDYADSMEVTYDNPKVNWLKEMRLAERLIGPFTWSSFNRSFDGVKLGYDRTGFNFTSIVVHPTQGGFENDAHNTIEGIDLATLTFTMKYDQWISNTESRLFYFYYHDNRNIPKVDNITVSNPQDIEIHSFGFHLLGTANIGSGVADGILWGVFQTGDWGKFDHEAWAALAELGYQWVGVPWTPWVRIGYHISSGDSDPNDGKHGTFYQMVPTVRKYALFPFFNQMNNEDVFLQAILKPWQKLVVRTDCHYLRLQDRDDRWYMGAGPTRERGNIFGYVGRPSLGGATLGTLLDLTLVYTINKYSSVVLYGGHVFGGDVLENIYRDKNGNMAYCELTFKF